MKEMWKLSNYFFIWMVKRGFFWTLLLGLAAAGGNLLANAFPRAAEQRDAYHLAIGFLPYERILDESWIPIYFLAGLVLVFGIIFWHAKSYSTNGKEIYTLFTLPMKREMVYFALLLSGMALLAFYFLAWLILLLIAYAPMMSNYAQAAAEEVFRISPELTISGLDATRMNGLYLAFVRSSWLSAAFPASPTGLLLLVGRLLLSLTGLLFAGFCPAEPIERVVAGLGGLYFGFVFGILELWWNQSFGYFLEMPTKAGSALTGGLCCLILAGVVVCRSLRCIRKCYSL